MNWHTVAIIVPCVNKGWATAQTLDYVTNFYVYCYVSVVVYLINKIQLQPQQHLSGPIIQSNELIINCNSRQTY